MQLTKFILDYRNYLDSACGNLYHYKIFNDSYCFNNGPYGYVLFNCDGSNSYYTDDHCSVRKTSSPVLRPTSSPAGQINSTPTSSPVVAPTVVNQLCLAGDAETDQSIYQFCRQSSVDVNSPPGLAVLTTAPAKSSSSRSRVNVRGWAVGMTVVAAVVVALLVVLAIMYRRKKTVAPHLAVHAEENSVFEIESEVKK